MGVEIERKFLVDIKKWQQVAKPTATHLKQGYIINDKYKTIRVRIAGKQGYLTIKGSTSGISRKEYEYPIPIKDAMELLDDFAASWVEKNRYCINFAGKKWEVDEFLGDNEGLVMAEIELKHEESEFEVPAWITKEVSDDNRYFNSSLAVKPFSKWGK